ncbi:MAG: peptidase [Ectothiorhodospiraceae bacterium]|nr:peptidase [Ectothiorhodospiraceae bacterium]
MAKHTPRVLLVFVDGVGYGTRDPKRNPMFAGEYPFLTDLFSGSLPSIKRPVAGNTKFTLSPIQVNMGVPGLPQSGTGQTALYTGINAAKYVGKHFGPYVYSTLKPVLEEHGIYARLLERGFPADELALANAFPQRFFDYLAGPKRRMVAGAYMARSAGIRFRDIKDLKRGTAISTDITAVRWKNIGHPDAPVDTPEAAGRKLANIASEHRFTLFEYFLTDKAGHDMDMSAATEYLSELDGMLSGIWDAMNHDKLLVLLTSDHGNLEELSRKTHTRNRVPLLAFGKGHREFSADVSRITDITPAICSYLTGM